MKSPPPIAESKTSVQQVLLVAASLVILLFGLRLASGFLAPLFLAVTLAVLFTPLLWRLEKKGLSHGLALLAMVLIFGGFFVGMFIILRISLEELSHRLPEYAQLLQQRISNLGALGTSLQNSLNQIVVDVSTIAKSAVELAIGVISNGVSLCFFLYLLFLMLAESKLIAERFQNGLHKDSNLFTQLRGYTKLIQKQYSIQAISNFVTAVALTIEFILFRVDFAILWGFLAFVLSFIPYVGLIVACVPAIIIAFILHGWTVALVILLVAIILNIAVDNVVMPRIYGVGLNLPVLFVFLSFMFWSWIFGFFGALLALPATLLVKSLLKGRKDTVFIVSMLSREEETEQVL